LKGRSRATVAITILIAIPVLVRASAALTGTFSSSGLPVTLRQRVVWPKPVRTTLNPAKARADVIVVKFLEGTHVRERAGQLEADLRNLSDAEERLLERANLPRQRLFEDLARFNSLIGPGSKRFVRRLFTRPENELDADKRAGESRIGEELADLNLYYLILAGDAKVDETQRLIDQLNALDAVEMAYPQPVLPAVETGIAPGASPAAFFPEVRDVRVVDIGRSGNTAREDSPAPGQTCVPGSCPPIDDFEDAISKATAALHAGDMMLIARYAPGPDSGLTASCRVDQFESVAIEFWDADFDVVRNATSRGIIVVESAGNGSMDLDSPIYARKFDRSFRDSGAIVVGAGLQDARSTACSPNLGSRVDVRGWGDSFASVSAASLQNILRAGAGGAGRIRSLARRNDPGGGDNGPTPLPDPPACLRQAKVSFEATKPTVDFENSATELKWQVFLPSTCPRDVGPLLLDGQPVANVGTKPLQPMATTSFSLTIGYKGGTETLATTTVTVKLPNPIDIKGSTLDWKRAMIQALNTAGETVRLAPNIDMDLTGFHDIVITEGVSFLGGEPCLVRTSSSPHPQFQLCGGHDAQHPGPRIYTNTYNLAPLSWHLFQISCVDGNKGDNVRLSGFRLQGPHWDPVDGDENQEVGIYIESCRGIDVGNMELSGWSWTPVYVIDEKLNRQTTPEDVRIHDNFIHHNQHIGENGYGVSLGAGGYALIEHNVFDFNRHAISAVGRPDTGYTAYQNLVLKGGGVHGKWYKEYTHMFDVHGDRDCGGPLNCGNAGQSIRIIANAFQYLLDSAIKIRGEPSYGVFINQNVFAHDRIGGAEDSIYKEAVKYNAPVKNINGILSLDASHLHIGQGDQANILNTDTYGQYGVCDFDGDGKDDLFLGTGVTWWYMSRAKRQWVYLNSFPERVDQVGLGDFDGDHRCDVFTVHGDDWVISSGGTAPWTSLGKFGIPFDQLRFGDFNGDGIKDIFRRAPNGQWFIVSPGIYGSTAVQSSDSPLSDLRFGDFNNNGITDVIAIKNGHWSVSWDARSTWQPLNPSLSDSLASVLITDLNGNGKDEILRWVATSAVTGRWEVSWDGRTNWQPLTSVAWPITDLSESPAYRLRAFVGRFGDTAGGDLLNVDFTRYAKIFDKATRTFAPHSIYAY
jgi:hypothetical protein